MGRGLGRIEEDGGMAKSKKNKEVFIKKGVRNPEQTMKYVRKVETDFNIRLNNHPVQKQY